MHFTLRFFLVIAAVISLPPLIAAQSPEEKLASLDGKATAAQFGVQIDGIIKKCKPTTRIHAADIAVITVRNMKDRGRVEGLFQVLRAINESIPEGFVQRVDVNRVAAAITVMSTSADYRNGKIEDVVLDLRALLRKDAGALDRLGR